LKRPAEAILASKKAKVVVSFVDQVSAEEEGAQSAIAHYPVQESFVTVP
jgi:hypothetical protein